MNNKKSLSFLVLLIIVFTKINALGLFFNIGEDFSKKDLSFSYYAGTTAISCNFSQANLDCIDLSNSKLILCDFSLTNLGLTNLAGAKLYSNLTGVILPYNKKDLKGTDFKNSYGLSNKQKKFLREKTEAINIPKDSKTLKEQYQGLKERCQAFKKCIKSLYNKIYPGEQENPLTD